MDEPHVDHGPFCGGANEVVLVRLRGRLRSVRQGSFEAPPPVRVRVVFGVRHERADVAPLGAIEDLRAHRGVEGLLYGCVERPVRAEAAEVGEVAFAQVVCDEPNSGIGWNRADATKGRVDERELVGAGQVDEGRGIRGANEERGRGPWRVGDRGTGRRRCGCGAASVDALLSGCGTGRGGLSCGADALEEHGRGLVGGILGNELPAEGFGEDGCIQLLQFRLCSKTLLEALCDSVEPDAEHCGNLRLLSERWERNDRREEPRRMRLDP